MGQRHKGVGKKHLREAAAKKHDSRMRKIEVNMKNLWIKIGVIVAVIILVAGLGFRITMLKSVKIKGNVLYTNEEIKEFIMPGIWNKNAFVLYVKDKLFGLKEPSFVQEIELEWTSRRNVIVHVYEKAIIGCVKYMNHYVYFDRDGIVLESTVTPLAKVPYVTGVDFGNFVLHEKISVDDDAVFAIIMNLSQVIAHLKMDIERIHINSGNEVILIAGDIKVYLGKQEMYDEALTALASVLKTAKKEKYKGEIDLSNYKHGMTITLSPEDREKKGKKKRKKNSGKAEQSQPSTESALSLPQE